MSRQVIKKKTGRTAVKQFKAWSYSRWTDYDGCPRRSKYKHLDKLPEGKKGKALVRGSAIHDEGEQYLKGEVKGVPKSYAPFAKEMRALRKVKAIGEGSWTFTKDWDLTEWNDWDNAWLRMKIDAHVIKKNTLRIIDYKTGKVRESNLLQLELYGLGGLLRFEEVETVVAEFWYLDHGEAHEIEFVRAEADTLRDEWLRRIKPMMTDKTFKARPSYQCKWCPYSKAKDGPCEF